MAERRSPERRRRPERRTGYDPRTESGTTRARHGAAVPGGARRGAPAPVGHPIDRSATLELLRDGELEITGRLVDASNVTLYGSVLCRAEGDRPARHAACVYKPIRGERPLDDFPIGTLAYREVAAHAVSMRAGWGIVPPSVFRDGPLGPGMVQAWIEVDDEIDVVTMILTRDPRLRRMALFDAVINNADRKGGHVLPVADGHVYGVDHGVCFSPDPKLRTVLWGWRGERLAHEERALLETLRADLGASLGDELRELLARREVTITARRIEALLDTGSFPMPDPSRPAIPWPPF